MTSGLWEKNSTRRFITRLSSSTSPLRTPLSVVVSVDVEEEGLFSGKYAATGCGVRNVQALARLAPLTTELGFPLTLLCSHTVFESADACRVLERLRDRAGAEIGAHLHHWSTPPLFPHTSTTPPRTHTLPRELLKARLQTLLEAGRVFNGAPLTSFRMGRWDLKASVRPLLAQMGIKVDSSVCPLRVFDNDGPDHFLAPADPYWPANTPPLLEVPITQIPTLPCLAKTWYALWRGRTPHGTLLDTFHYFGALSPNPVWHGDTVMRLAARWHWVRGGRVLCLFWHSSEMMPGGSPHIPDQAAADRLYTRIYNYLRWLREALNAQGTTLSRLAQRDDFPHIPTPQHGDW